MGIEIWKTVQGYEGRYEVSNFGRVRSLDRRVYIRPKGVRTTRAVYGMMLNGSLSTPGYLTVSLCGVGKNKRASVHRIVALHFVDNPHNKKYVNHKDGVKTNNHFSNLEYVTGKENSIHAHKIGLFKKRRRKSVIQLLKNQKDINV